MALTNPTAWSDRLELLLQSMCECLEENTALGAPTTLDLATGLPVFNCYKIHSDEWPGDCCDALILKVARVYQIDATAGLPTANIGNPRNTKCGSSLGADVAIRLFRPCGVMAGGSNVAPSLPSGDSLNSEAESSLLDINALMCCLSCDPGFSDSNGNPLPMQFVLGSATQFKSGDCYGWEIKASVSLPFCAITP